MSQGREHRPPSIHCVFSYGNKKSPASFLRLLQSKGEEGHGHKTKGLNSLFLVNDT